MNRLKNKVAIVTGGSNGIGKSACMLMAEEGAKVAITDISDDEGKILAEEIKSAGYKAEYWHLNVADEENVKNIFSDIYKKFGKLDILVNNAGIAGVNKPTHEITSDEWDKVINVNVKGAFYCTKYAIPYMKENGSGSIINMSSIYGLVGAADSPPYHASKGALRLMTKTEALLYAKDKIRVNSIHPGFIITPMVETFLTSSPESKEIENALINLHPLGHLGEPSDIGYGVVYLASDESKFVTGSELVIDGGYTSR